MYYSEGSFQWSVFLTGKVTISFKQLLRCMAGVKLMLQYVKNNFSAVVLQRLTQ